MIDRFILPLQARLLRPVARVLVRRGICADQVTLAGFVVGMLAVPAIVLHLPLLCLVLIALNRLADGLDGEVARLGTPGPRGAFLDITLDFLFYAAIPLGFALADPAQNALPAAVLLAAFLGTGASFLGFAVLAAQQGKSTRDYPTKGIYYLGGLTEGTETIALFVAFCAFPAAFPPLAYGFALACLFTIITRLAQGWRAFNPTTTE